MEEQMKKRNIVAIILVFQMLIVLATGCASKADSGADNGGGTNNSAGASANSGSNGSNSDAKPSDSGASSENEDDSDAAAAVKVDKKFVSKNYMLTTLTNNDCTISEDESGLNFYTQNAAINITLTPGVQNLATAATFYQSAIPTYFADGQAGDISDGYLFGFRAKLLLFSCSFDNTPCEGLMALSVANQSLYTMSLLINDKTTEYEFALMQEIITNMLLLAPTSVDTNAHTAQYTDPYADYGYYEDYDYYDISEWYYLPYEYYYWCEADYSVWDDPSYYDPDWDYYVDDSMYWEWGWDDSDEWYFYDTYEDYYDIETYETEEDYYADYDYDSYDVWESEDFGYYDEGYNEDAYDDEEYYEEGSNEDAYED
jgi:hypothetical protein